MVGPVGIGSSEENEGQLGFIVLFNMGAVLHLHVKNLLHLDTDPKGSKSMGSFQTVPIFLP